MKFGTFDDKAREYVISTPRTPLPWINYLGMNEFFSIVYEDNSGHQRLFFPDYVLRFGGETWIIEVKGGWTSGRQCQNIDPYAAKKAAALNSYCKKHCLRGGFVCYDESEDILLMAEEGYSEDVTSSCWKPIE